MALLHHRRCLDVHGAFTMGILFVGLHQGGWGLSQCRKTAEVWVGYGHWACGVGVCKRREIPSSPLGFVDDAAHVGEGSLWHKILTVFTPGAATAA